MSDWNVLLAGLLSPWAQTGQPGVAAMLSVDGEPFAFSSGCARVAEGLAFDVDTPARIGSVTKPFVGALLAVLAAEGKLALDEPASRWLPELPAPQGVTLRQLAGHVSGLPCYVDTMLMTNGLGPHELDDSRLLDHALAITPRVFSPGHRFLYSNTNYLLLTLAIERAGGRAIAEQLRHRLLEPAGLGSAGYAPRDRDLPPSVAHPHVVTPSGTCKVGAFLPMSGDGAMFASTRDLLRWAEWLMARPALHAELTSPAAMTGGRLAGYGLGLAQDTRCGGITTIRHGGAVNGGVAFVGWAPALKLRVAITACRGDIPVEALWRRIVAAASGATESPAPAPLMAGHYEDRGDGRLYEVDATVPGLVRVNGWPSPLTAEGETWRVDSLGLDVRLSADGDDLRVVESGRQRPATRMAARPSDAIPAGRYRCAAAQVQALVGDGTLRLQGPLGAQAFNLAPISGELFAAVPPGLPVRPVVRFGERCLTLSSTRAPGLHFERM